MKKKTISIFWIFLLSVNSILSQDSLFVINPNDTNPRNLTTFIIPGAIAYAGGMSFIIHNKQTAEDRVDFHFFNDNKGYLQVDKFQHAFYSYVESYIGYKLLRSQGIKKNNALLFGGTLGFILQTPKELIDGYYDPGGFSWGDVMANATGSAFVICQEYFFDEQILKYKTSFSRSVYADQANSYLGNSAYASYFHDYNGHTYWFSLNINKIFLKRKLPDWLNVAVGYSANGMFGQFENLKSFNGVPIPETQRYRQYLLSLDIDWTKIKTRNKFLKIIFNGISFVKIPFPTIEINSKGQFRGYWLYF